MSCRVGFDVSILPHALGGIGRYLSGLAAGLLRTQGLEGVEVSVVDVPAAHPGLASPGLASARLKTPSYMRVPLLRRIPVSRGTEPASRGRRLAGLGRFDIYHHSGVQPAFPAGSASVVTLYDTSALEHPEWFTADTVRYACIEARLARAGSRMVAISAWSASRAAEVIGLPQDGIFVIGGAADDSFTTGDPDPAVLSRLGLERDTYILHVGNFVPSKNIPFLISAYSDARLSGLELKLVLVGAGGWMRPDATGQGVVALEAVPDDVLRTLYRGAALLVAPGLGEGLCLPLLEAFACGCGAICSSAGALPETAAGCAMVLDPSDRAAWSAALRRTDGMAFPEELRGMAAAHARTTWREVALRLRSFYRGICG